jgi:hypothetical protein
MPMRCSDRRPEDGPDYGTVIGKMMASCVPENGREEYIASHPPDDSTPEHPNGEIVFSCEIPAQ